LPEKCITAQKKNVNSSKLIILSKPKNISEKVVEVTFPEHLLDICHSKQAVQLVVH
jgi:translation elongation factor EF-Ts